MPHHPRLIGGINRNATYKTLPSSSKPVLTVGPKAGSGADFDPGTNPTTGDTAGTDIATALQAALNAAVASPFSVNRPAVVQLLAGVHNMWNAGTTPIPTLLKSGRQLVIGEGMRASAIMVNSATAEAAITVGASPFTYTNNSGHAQQVKVTVNGATISSIVAEGTTMTDPSGSGNATSGTFCIHNGGTLVLTYSAGSPLMSASLSLFMFNADPIATGGGFKDLEVKLNPATNSWSFGLDYSSDPNNGLQYAETTKPVICENIFTSNDSGWDIASVLMDGCEGARLKNPDISGKLYWRVPHGELNIDSGFVLTAHLGGQIVNITSTSFQNAGNSGIGIVLDAVNLGNNGFQGSAPVIPMTVNCYAPYFSGSTTAACISNNNAMSNTIINFYGGYYQVPAGTAPAGYVINNLTTLYINNFGVPIFSKLTNNAMPLVAGALGGYSETASPQFTGVETRAAFYTNLGVGFAATTPSFPGTGVDAQNTTGNAVVITITGIGGGVTAYGVTDVLGTLSSVTAAVIVGEQFYLANQEKIRFTITSGSPTWKWRGLVVGS